MRGIGYALRMSPGELPLVHSVLDHLDLLPVGQFRQVANNDHFRAGEIGPRSLCPLLGDLKPFAVTDACLHGRLNSVAVLVQITTILVADLDGSRGAPDGPED